MSAIDAPPRESGQPYVSLLDQVRDLARVLTNGGDQLVTPAEIPGVLTALVHVIEHGHSLIEASRYGYDRVEDMLTPDRPEGWVRPVQALDPREQTILSLRAEIARLTNQPADPRDQEIERLTRQVQAARDQAHGGVTGPSQPTGQPGAAPPFDPDIAARQQAELFTRLAAAAPTSVTVEHENGETERTDNYDELNRDQLKDRADALELEVDGTGSDGYVTVEDYKKALREHDTKPGKEGDQP